MNSTVFRRRRTKGLAEIEHELVAGQRIERTERLVHEQMIGIAMSARQIETRWRMPPESSWGNLSSKLLQPDRLQQFAGARLRFLAVHLARFLLCMTLPSACDANRADGF